MMKPGFILAAAIFGTATVPALAQDANAPGLGEVVVTSNRLNARYAQQDRPVVGLRRQADSAVLQLAIASDSRDEAVRKREIHTILLAALDRAAAAGVELVTGSFELVPVTKATYQDLPLVSAGRVDTSQANLMIKVKLAGSTAAAEQRLGAFIKSVPRTGRGTIDRAGVLTLTIVNPDQYRDAIVTLVADNARHYAAIFGPDYAVQVSGVDGQVSWSQVSGTDVFLYVPYRYVIVPK
ncbi:MAG: TonB-dependent receptor [Sphingomonas bacterium]|uniref:TonB-dependent receptor n=1 Tax=Sphingomonas bacterium TaxID=1895847 RepID=UPI002619B492|nr:TonB-dependent receptor [Sphingomonas bacterium]MDB5706629.1 TonB-dependent receptor [Sphingomonas bacterium]